MTDKIDITPEAVARMLDGVTRTRWIAGGPIIYLDGGIQPHIADLTDMQDAEANAAFIVYAREALPVLAARLAELERKLDAARQIERNVQSVREHEFQRAETAEARVAELEGVLRGKTFTVDQIAELEAENARLKVGQIERIEG